MCVVVGSKYVKLFPPEDGPYLYRNFDDSQLSNATHLPVDLIENPPNTTDFPEYTKASETETILIPGDALFIPKGWWHFVKSLETSANVALFFN